jgi:hypothetical protein
MGVLRTVVQVAVLPMFDAREALSRRRAIAGQPIGDDDPWHVTAVRETLAEARLGRMCVPSALHEHIQDMAALIHHLSEIMTFAVNGEQDHIQMPRVAWLRASASELMGRDVAECPTPLADRLIDDNDAACEQACFPITVAEAEADIPPHRMADHLGWETVVLVGVGEHWRGHPTRISHATAAQHVDNAMSEFRAGADGQYPITPAARAQRARGFQTLVRQTAQNSRDFQLVCEWLSATPEVATRLRRPLTVPLDGLISRLRRLKAMLAEAEGLD